MEPEDSDNLPVFLKKTEEMEVRKHGTKSRKNQKGNARNIRGGENLHIKSRAPKPFTYRALTRMKPKQLKDRGGGGSYGRDGDGGRKPPNHSKGFLFQILVDLRYNSS